MSTPPIRVRRRWTPEYDGWDRPLIILGKSPWWWTCRSCLGLKFGAAATHPAALAAGLAHLADHMET